MEPSCHKYVIPVGFWKGIILIYGYFRALTMLLHNWKGLFNPNHGGLSYSLFLESILQHGNGTDLVHIMFHG